MVFALNQSENHASYKGKMVKLSVVCVHGIKMLSAIACTNIDGREIFFSQVNNTQSNIYINM